MRSRCIGAARPARAAAVGRSSTSVERLSDQQAGDDKITCAGAQTAHDAALEFLARL